MDHRDSSDPPSSSSRHHPAKDSMSQRLESLQVTTQQGKPPPLARTTNEDDDDIGSVPQLLSATKPVFKIKMKPLSAGLTSIFKQPDRVSQLDNGSPVETGSKPEVISGFGTFAKPIIQNTDPDSTGGSDVESDKKQSSLRQVTSVDLEGLVTQTRLAARTLTGRAVDDELEKFKPQERPESSSSDDDSDLPGPRPPPAPTTTSQDDDESYSDDDDLPGPKPPVAASSSATSKKKAEEYDSFDDLSDSDDDVGGATRTTSGGVKTMNRYAQIPMTSELELEHGSKAVTALAFEPAGGRFVTGGADYEVRYWDFQGMDSTLSPYRAAQPCECHPIKALDFSANGELVLIVSGMAKVKIVDRDGHVKGESDKGDQYITDQNQTRGHTAMLNDGAWNPRVKSAFMTCSNDGTVRLWDADVGLKKQQSVIKMRSSGGTRAAPTVCRYSRDAKLLAAACSDGSVQMWDTGRGNFVNTTHIIRRAHAVDAQISSLSFSYDGNLLATRGVGDHTLKLWDMRALRKGGPVHTAAQLHNRYEQTDCAFSPDSSMIMTGLSADKDPTNPQEGGLIFLDSKTFQEVKRIPLAAGGASVIRCLWHPRLNQILLSTSTGRVRVLYDDKLSDRGVKLCRFRNRAQVQASSSEAAAASSSDSTYDSLATATGSRRLNIITPHALPMFKEDRKRSRLVQDIKNRKDPILSRRPDLPVTGPGAGGRIASAGSTYSSYIARNIAVKNKLDETLDPRQIILRHAKECEEKPYWVAPAYQATQPKPIYATDDADDDSDDEDGASSSKKQHIPV